MDGSIERLGASAGRGDLFAGRIARIEQSADEDVADVAAREMEALFATILVAEMRKGLGEGFFGSGPGADTFAGWFDEQLGASIASRGSLGLGDDVREAILRQRAAESHEDAEGAR